MFAIDCGNSRIKWARFADGRIADKVAVDLRGSVDPFAALGVALGTGTDRVLIANVAGAEVAASIAKVVASRRGSTAEFVRAEASAFGIACAYREPATLGVDRWLGMIAARHVLDGPFAVVGAGTAVTFDAVDAGGQHLGGLILPGDRLMIEALANNTGQIDRVPPAGAPVTGLDLLGRSTAEAVSHGSRLALAAAIDRALAVVAAALGGMPPVLVTGGAAMDLVPWLETEAAVRADLVLEGLAVVAGELGKK
jgi:type III pantothenate kinase